MNVIKLVLAPPVLQ